MSCFSLQESCYYKLFCKSHKRANKSMHIQIPCSPEAIKCSVSTRTDDTFKLWSAIYTLLIKLSEKQSSVYLEGCSSLLPVWSQILTVATPATMKQEARRMNKHENVLNGPVVTTLLVTPFVTEADQKTKLSTINTSAELFPTFHLGSWLSVRTSHYLFDYQWKSGNL